MQPSRQDLRAQAFAAFGQDWRAASELWARYRADHPGDADGYVFGVLALREAGAVDQAERLAAAALERFADTPRLFVERALICFRTRDWTEAGARFQAIRARFPDEIEGYIRGAEVAHNVGDLAQAFALLARAEARFPASERLLHRQIELAEAVSDWERAATAWRRLRDRCASEDAFIGEARSVSRAHSFEAAEAVLRAGLGRHADSPGLIVEAARNATRHGIWEIARQRWTALPDRADIAAEARLRLQEAAFFLARRRAGKPILAADAPAMPLGPTAQDLIARTWTLRYDSGHVLGRKLRLTAHGEVLGLEGDSRSWTIHDRCVCLLDRDRRVHCRFSGVALDDSGAITLTGRDWHRVQGGSMVLQEERRPVADIMARFESLGDTCEFGLVQRFFGIEPLGLFRFNYARIDRLLQALDDGFAELDKPGCVRVERADGEHIGIVDAYGYRYHTGLYDDDLDIARFTRTEARRLRFLRRKLFEDMAAGDRIFVRKGEGEDAAGAVAALHAQVRRHGGGTLLWVSGADAAHPAGSVATMADGLLRGRIEHFAPPHAAAHAMFSTWSRICYNAHALVFGSDVTA